jgi:hypothetical protein
MAPKQNLVCSWQSSISGFPALAFRVQRSPGRLPARRRFDELTSDSPAAFRETGKHGCFEQLINNIFSGSFDNARLDLG